MKQYDLIYVNRGFDKYYNYAKNWTTAVKCLEVLANNTDLRILVLTKNDLPETLEGKVTKLPVLSQKEFMTYIT